jgi:hypothetical protein
MSLIFIDGFDHYSEIREKWTVTSPFDQPTFVGGRFGGQALRKQFQNSIGNITKNMGPQTEVFFGVAMQFPGLPLNSESFFRFADTQQSTRYSVIINADGSISVSAGGFTATSLPNVLVAGSSWFYIEGHYIAKDTAGAGGIVEVRVDGVLVVSIDGTLNKTTTGATDDIAYFSFYDDGTNSSAYLYDDLYLSNGTGTEHNTYLGDVRVTALYAKGNGTTNNFTSSSGGSNYLDVDEAVLDGDVSYVASGAVGAKEDYNIQDFADAGVTPGIIYAAQVCNGTHRTDAGTISFKNKMTVAGTEYTDDVEYVANSGGYLIDTYLRNTDPSDSGTWTEAKIAAAGTGLEITGKEEV